MTLQPLGDGLPSLVLGDVSLDGEGIMRARRNDLPLQSSLSVFPGPGTIFSTDRLRCCNSPVDVVRLLLIPLETPLPCLLLLG